jgi:DNA helicase-2/ATP-dependent DNA helicase PcrA
MELNHLNEQQAEAVRYTDGPLLVLAGAGSGKTRVLTYKIAYLMKEMNVYPNQILAITFTNKAAGEMKNRIYNLVGESAYSLWMGTFHSISVKILRMYSDKIGYNKDFVIYDSLDQKSIIKQCLKDLDINKEQFSVKMIMGKISQAKNQMIFPENFLEVYPTDIVVARVYDYYEQKMKKSNGMDFDNIILNLIRLLKEQEDVRNFYRNHFKYVLVDEYQDTNKAQYEMISLLTKGKGNLFVVGDNDQSIYGWRGADIRNISEFEKDFEQAKIIKLEQNYRSTQTILKAANGVIKNNLYRREKNLWSELGEGDTIRYYPADTEYFEADYVVSEIARLIRDGYQSSEIVILYRTNAQSRLFEERLRQQEIPYQIVGGTGFYQRKEIKDMMAYLKLVQNSQDEVGLQRIINEPKRGIGLKSIEKLYRMRTEDGLSLFHKIPFAIKQGVVAGKAAKGLEDLHNLISKLSQAKEEIPLTDLLMQLYEKSGYKEMLIKENSDQAQSRRENVGELINTLAEYQMNNEEGTLGGFLEDISLISDIDKMDDDVACVTMMTLHSAKGLEYPVVFMVGLEEGLFPTSRAFDQVEQMEEERRLCYVGMTRAEKLLYITSANQRTLYGQSRYNIVSRFIDEIPVDLLKNLNPKVKSKMKEPNPQAFLKKGMSSQRITTPAKKQGKLESVSTGMRVRHKMFGLGTVVSFENKVATIAFENKGIKKLNIEYAPLHSAD